LALTDDEKANVVVACEEMYRLDLELQKRFAHPAKPWAYDMVRKEEAWNAYQARRRDNDKVLRDFLPQAKVKRLKQIIWQFNDLPASLCDREVRKALKMDDDLARKIIGRAEKVDFDDLAQKHSKRLNGSTMAFSTASRQAATDEVLEIRRNIARDAMSPEQRQRWDELIGPKAVPFKTSFWDRENHVARLEHIGFRD
jgi:hypothetical protein